MSRIFRLLDWIEYLCGRGRRKAWCEITGGHDDYALGAWTGQSTASHFKMHCERCHRETGWVKVPLRTASVTNDDRPTPGERK